MTDLVFEKFPKIGRLKRDCTITEKIDGTNGQLVFNSEGSLLVGSRKREIFPEGTEGKVKGCDNFGFAQWAYTHKEELFDFLGEGRHYGEWCGLGIQRNYGLNEKRFLLFNVLRYLKQEIPKHLKEIGLNSVPILYQGPFSSDVVEQVMKDLNGSSELGNGFSNPEGIIIFHHAIRMYAKQTFKNDKNGKENKS